ncbi:zinc finger BED domain-containing protein 5-like [Palaemon carinicauda]|uniref:zinc finger BED domain-containing protein 5-like n=1 Tax=Palaemon carinicauda TaxID=392227 RepID=UPI0035B5C7DF
MNRVIRIINFVKTSALNTRLFKLLCEDFGSDHICLLYHTEVRWLSRGNTTRRLFELRDVLLVFFKEKEHNFQKDLEDEEFISRLAYLSDIFGALNHLNLSFQGPDCTVTEFISKLGGFFQKLDLLMKNVESKHYGMFELLTTLEREPTDEFDKEIVHHLLMLKTELKHYFLDVTCCAYVANPFSVDPADLPVGTGEQKELIDIQADETAKTKHKECSPLNLWVVRGDCTGPPSGTRSQKGWESLNNRIVICELFVAVYNGDKWIQSSTDLKECSR